MGTALASLTLAGHTAGGGMVDPVGLAIVAGMSAALAAALSGHPLRIGRLIVVLVAGQALLHTVLTFSAGHAHLAGAQPATGVMIGAHVAAALVAAGLIWRADELAARWGAFIATVLGVRPAPPAAPTSPSASVVRATAAPSAALLLLLHGVVRRGPPAPAAFLPA